MRDSLNDIIDGNDVDDFVPPGHGEPGRDEDTLWRRVGDHCERCGRPMWDRPVGALCKCGKRKGDDDA